MLAFLSKLEFQLKFQCFDWRSFKSDLVAISKWVLTVRVRRDEEVKREKVAEETGTGDKPQTVRGHGAVSKNALCPCGSGKKYKRCCGKDLD